MNWLRLYHEVLDDPKVQRLDARVFRAWINLLCLASRSQPRGLLSEIDDIAFALRMTAEEARSAVETLIECGLLEQGQHGLSPHNWERRQAKSDDVSSRVRKHRAAVSGNVASAATPNIERSTEKRSGNDREREEKRERYEEERRLDIGAGAPAQVTPIEKGKRGTKAPKHFDLDAEHYDAAETMGFTTQQTVDETARFLDWHRAKGTTHVDWTAAWRNWMRKARDIRAQRGQSKSDAEYWAEFDRLTGGGDDAVEAGQ
jgi:hypothetical protein